MLRWSIVIALVAVPWTMAWAAEPSTLVLHKEPLDAAAPEKPVDEVATDAAADAAAGETVAEPEKPAPKPVADLCPRALKKPMKFHSKGQMRALLFKMDRDMEISFQPVLEGDTLKAVDAHVVDNVNSKTFDGRLALTPRGSLRAQEPQLINAANIISVDPVVRAQLTKGEGPIVTHGQIETAGTVRIVEFTHSLVGEPAEDGSMQVETATESADGKVHMKTVTTIAPDGLPWLAETTGTVKKGPVDVSVELKLTRDMGDETGD